MIGSLGASHFGFLWNDNRKGFEIENAGNNRDFNAKNRSISLSTVCFGDTKVWTGVATSFYYHCPE
jgi:hypothetical protein